MRKWTTRFAAVFAVAIFLFAGIAFAKGKAPANEKVKNKVKAPKAAMMNNPGFGGHMQGMRGQGNMGMGGLDRLINDTAIVKELELSQTQVDRIKKINKEARITQIRNGADIQILEIELEELLDTAMPNVKEVDAKIEAIGKKKTDVQKQMTHGLIEIKATLTKEQNEKIQKFMKRGGQGMRGMGGDMQCPNCPFKNGAEGNMPGRGMGGPGMGQGMMMHGGNGQGMMKHDGSGTGMGQGMMQNKDDKEEAAPCPLHQKGGMMDGGMSVPESK